MPFGLRNVSQSFQRFVDAVFIGLDLIFAYIYVIVIHEQHQEHLKQFFQRLRDTNWLSSANVFLDKSKWNVIQSIKMDINNLQNVLKQ